ncbi:cytochrome P450 [Acidocella aquatica]|uniref:Cytochrome P450 n=1 Tax=Acidocella aquatica TaxID=1922313 RepID=A0ABQ6A5I8_9PROT|nr:cytochrome P450 [Acidocella aquatica]GLR66553.1 cytochrome P450 [Acidocella aquatica]
MSLQEKISPQDMDFSMGDLESISDEKLLPALARLREHAPVYWSERNRCWQITKYDDIAAAFQDMRFSNVRLSFSALRSIPEPERAQRIPNLLRYIQGWIVNVDGDTHKRLRSVTTKALSKKFVDSLKPLIQSLSVELTEKAVKLHECDFARDIAYFLPATVILTLLGLPLEHLEKVREWNRAITAGLSAAFASAEALINADRAIAEMNSMLRVEIAKRLAAPQQDFLTQLVTLADDSNNVLSEDEVLGLCHIFLTAGHETTVNSLVMGLAALVKNPDQQKILLGGAVEPLGALQELLRYIGMSTVQPRVAATDFEFAGQQIKKGDVAFLWILSANNDPQRFPEPGKLDFTRGNVGDVVTFGPGLHHCVGHYLARIELDIFFRAFLPKFSKIEILEEKPVLSPTLTFRGFAHLNARFTV